MIVCMDSVRVGRQLRALRHRRRWRQEELAAAARVSRSLVGRVEQGGASRLTVARLEQLVAPLGARLVCRLEWHGEALDRLVDADHAAIVERLVANLGMQGWRCATEISFNVYGERGSIDVLAFHPVARVVLVIEVKSVVPDVQATLVAIDRKWRLAARIARERGWIGTTAARLLVIRDTRTARRRIEAHDATFRASFPDRSWAVRRWIAHPDPRRPFSGLWFLPVASQAGAGERVRHGRGSAAHEGGARS